MLKRTIIEIGELVTVLIRIALCRHRERLFDPGDRWTSYCSSCGWRWLSDQPRVKYKPEMWR